MTDEFPWLCNEQSCVKMTSTDEVDEVFRQFVLQKQTNQKQNPPKPSTNQPKTNSNNKKTPKWKQAKKPQKTPTKEQQKFQVN